MSEYMRLINNITERVAKDAEREAAHIVNLEKIEALLSIAESKLKAAGNAG